MSCLTFPLIFSLFFSGHKNCVFAGELMLILVCYFLGIHVSPVVNLDISIFFCWRLCCFLLVSSDFWFSARNCSLAPPGNRIIFPRHLMFFTFFIVSSECFDPHSALGNVFLFIMPDFQRESVMI